MLGKPLLVEEGNSMYDYFLCDMPMPTHPKLKGDCNYREYQTKSFGKFMDTYRVDIFGQLYRYDEPATTELVPHYGELRFYTLVESELIVFSANFVNGRTEKIELVESEMMLYESDVN